MTGKLLGLQGIKCVSQKEMGGLGVRDINKFNEVLIEKWKWRFGVDKNGVWKDLLETRYDTWRGMKSDRKNLKQSSWWKDLCKICDVRNKINWFDNNINCVLREVGQWRITNNVESFQWKLVIMEAGLVQMEKGVTGTITFYFKYNTMEEKWIK